MHMISLPFIAILIHHPDHRGVRRPGMFLLYEQTTAMAARSRVKWYVWFCLLLPIITLLQDLHKLVLTTARC